MQEHSSTPNAGGKKAALLAGLDALNTTWAVTLDADVRLQPEWGEAWLRSPGEPTRALRRGGGPRSTLGWPKHGDVWSGFGFGLRRTNGMVGRSNRPRPTRLGLWGQPRGPAICLPGHAPPRSVWRRRLGLANAVQRGMACRMDGRPSRQRLTPAPRTWREVVQQQLRWAGKAGHYLPHVQRTALWVAWTAVCPWMWLTFGILSQDEWGAALAVGFWLGLTAHNVAFVAPVAKWFGLPRKPWLWLGLACLQPIQVPVLALARLGLLRPFGIEPKPTWKGRTCTP